MAFALRVLLLLFAQLPLPLLHACGWLLGELLWRLPNRYRRISLRNLQLCFPAMDPGRRSRIARRSLIESAKSILEAPAVWFGPQWRLNRWLNHPAATARLATLDGPGNGQILLTLHMGAWEVAGQFAACGRPLTLLYKPQKGPADALIVKGRSRNPNAHPVPTRGAGVKALLGALKRGERVGILPDHDPPDGAGKFAALFGHPAHTMDLVSKLAARSGAPVSFLIAERLPWARGFRLHLIPAPAAIVDSERGATAMNAGIEACIRQWPEQYWWSYKRFRRLPPGVADPYHR
jgi:KDO2-lipid IV(A) lauroyltransferase